MITENQIRGLNLEARQRLVVDLRSVPTGDKSYATSRALIEFTTTLKGWKEPQKIAVENIAGHALTIDGVAVPKDATAQVYPWQFVALARFFKPVEKAAAALVISLVLLLFGSVPAMAQNQTFELGSSGSYNVLYVAGLNGGTNAWTGSLSFTNQVITTNQLISPNNINSNGIVYNFPTTNYVYTTNQPGVVNLANYDLADLAFSFLPLTAAGGVTGGTATWDYSPDASTWQLNAITAYVATNGLNLVSTNLQLNQFAPGYIRLDTITFPGSGFGSNVTVQVGRKVSKTGP